MRECIEQDLSEKTKNKLLYYIKLPPLLNSFSIQTFIKDKKQAYNLYYKLIKLKI